MDIKDTKKVVKDSAINRLQPNSKSENDQSKKASIDNENQNFQAQGDKDKF